MEGSRFDALARRAASRGSRRAAALGLAAVLARLTLGRDEAMAKPPRSGRSCRRRGKRAVLLCHNDKLKCVRRRNVEAHLDHGDQLGSCSTEPGAENCEGTNGCDMRCPVNSDTCFCRINDATREPFCGSAVFFVLNCGQCPGDTVCVDLSACGGAGAVGCASPCS